MFALNPKLTLVMIRERPSCVLEPRAAGSVSGDIKTSPQARPGRRDEALKGADGSHHGHNIAKYIPGSRWSEQNTSSEFIILSVFWHLIDSHNLSNVYPR